jgi:hypothetical protein
MESLHKLLEMEHFLCVHACYLTISIQFPYLKSTMCVVLVQYIIYILCAQEII